MNPNGVTLPVRPTPRRDTRSPENENALVVEFYPRSKS